MQVEDVDIIRQDKRGEQAAQERFPGYTQQFCDRTIRPHDQPQLAQGKIADRGILITGYFFPAGTRPRIGFSGSTNRAVDADV